MSFLNDREDGGGGGDKREFILAVFIAQYFLMVASYPCVFQELKWQYFFSESKYRKGFAVKNMYSKNSYLLLTIYEQLLSRTTLPVLCIFVY